MKEEVIKAKTTKNEVISDRASTFLDRTSSQFVSLKNSSSFSSSDLHREHKMMAMAFTSCVCV